MRDGAPGQERVLDRLPLWLRILGVIAAPGAVFLAARLIYEQTLLTWRRGPQMVGFALAHSGLVLPLLLSTVLMLLWCAAVLGRSLWALWRGKSVSRHRWAVLVASIALLLVPLVPYGSWQRLAVGRLASGPHATEFLTYAAATGNLGVVKSLLRSGIDLNAQNSDGSTALYAAVVGGQVQVIDYLLGQGADVNLRNKWANSPLHAAREMKRGDLMTILLAHGATE
jgi:ankyrin repeat protein